MNMFNFTSEKLLVYIYFLHRDEYAVVSCNQNHTQAQGDMYAFHSSSIHEVDLNQIVIQVSDNIIYLIKCGYKSIITDIFIAEGSQLYPTLNRKKRSKDNYSNHNNIMHIISHKSDAVHETKASIEQGN